MDITAENAELGAMPERKAEAIRTPRFFDLGVKLAYDFKLYKTVDLQLNGGVQNLQLQSCSCHGAVALYKGE
jgi:outer membrane receptor for ferrienterochelin and colicins